MNIKEAKLQVSNAIRAYRTRDEFGRLRISKPRQRPVFLVGAPGIGKTAIVEQIAKEMGIGLVSYSITHHTRQSALGLPYISEKEYGGETFRTSEYTMSEIIASVYKKMEETGIGEGILFLDEINCVSETLTPAMLQFLQYKVFGQHAVPDGWIVVTAGNPPEYNSSVHEFDMVTQDRLKRIDIEPDYGAWKEWAVDEQVHPCILSYLDIRKEDFYKVENTIDGRRFVTPRAWVDLSDMIELYECNKITVDELLIRQYLQDDQISKQFAVYYELWKKYSSDYQVNEILEGNYGEEEIRRAGNAPFDERISLIGLLLDGVKQSMKEVMDRRRVLVRVKGILTEMHVASEAAPENHKVASEELQRQIRALEEKTGKRRKELLTQTEEAEVLRTLLYLRKLPLPGDDTKLLEDAKESYRSDVDRMKEASEHTDARLRNLFGFVVSTYGEGAELMLVMTELTAAKLSAGYIAQYGSEEYYAYNHKLLFYERSKEVLKEIDEVL